jgi:Rod binding domain-containing protein
MDHCPWNGVLIKSVRESTSQCKFENKRLLRNYSEIYDQRVNLNIDDF